MCTAEIMMGTSSATSSRTLEHASKWLRARARLPGHQTDGRISIQTLAGHIKVRAEGQYITGLIVRCGNGHGDDIIQTSADHEAGNGGEYSGDVDTLCIDSGGAR